MAPALLAVAAWSVQFGTVVAAAALAVGMARVRSPRATLVLWQATLAAAAAAPLAAVAFFPAASPALVGRILTSAIAGTTAPSGQPPLETWSVVAGSCLVGGIALRLGFVLAGWRRLRRWASMPPAPSPVFDEVAAELGVRARLVCADGVASPFTFGCREPVVVADGRLLADPQRSRAVFLHELEHVSRRDWIPVVAEEIITAFLWFHPAAWWLTGRIRLAREEIVDRAAAARLGSRRAYLDALLSFSPQGDADWLLAPALAHRHQLARRIRSLALEVPMTRRHVVLASMIVALSVTCAAYAAAAAFPLRAADTGGHVLTSDDRTEKPVPTKKVNAVYPAEAKDKHVEGDVELNVRIGADGLVKDATVQKSVALLDEAALTAIRQWEFRPGRVNGKPADVITKITFTFRLK